MVSAVVVEENYTIERRIVDILHVADNNYNSLNSENVHQMLVRPNYLLSRDIHGDTKNIVDLMTLYPVKITSTRLWAISQDSLGISLVRGFFEERIADSFALDLEAAYLKDILEGDNAKAKYFGDTSGMIKHPDGSGTYRISELPTNVRSVMKKIFDNMYEKNLLSLKDVE